MSPDKRAPSSAPRRRRADAEQNRSALLDAARRLFDERGPDVPLDEVARTAGVANATLYRHFAVRAELIAAVYAQEVAALDELSRRLARHADADRALRQWLRAFVRHVASKRDLALALPDADERGVQFAAWHDTMLAAATRLLDRAGEAGVVRPGVRAADLLAVLSGAALTAVGAARVNAVLDLVRDGYRTR